MSNHEKIDIIVYHPKTLEGAQRLIEIFKECKLDNIDEEKFYHLYEKGEGDIGFFIKDGNWKVCGIDETMDNWFNITELIVLE